MSKLSQTGKFKEISLTANGLVLSIGGKTLSVKKQEEYSAIVSGLGYKQTHYFVNAKPLPKKKARQTKREKLREKIVEKGHKNYYIFFDIDSTLTKKLGIIENGVKKIFEKMQEQNTVIIFCTGRSFKSVAKLIEDYDTSEFGIAEAGGVIIGIDHPYYAFGNRDEPDKVINYLQKHNIPHVFDPKQHPRFTEFVLIKKSVDESQLKLVVEELGNKVDLHSTKNTIHITKKDINKGTAIKHLIAVHLRPDSDISTLIGVGDSHLDFPMFEECDENYLVAKHNSDIDCLARDSNDFKITKRLDPAPKSIRDLYELLYES